MLGNLKMLLTGDYSNYLKMGRYFHTGSPSLRDADGGDSRALLRVGGVSSKQRYILPSIESPRGEDYLSMGLSSLLRSTDALLTRHSMKNSFVDEGMR